MLVAVVHTVPERLRSHARVRRRFGIAELSYWFLLAVLAKFDVSFVEETVDQLGA
jgi:hypothetical protein